MSGTVHLFPLYAFMTCAGATMFSTFVLFLACTLITNSHTLFSVGSEVSSVELYQVVNFMFFLFAYSVIRCVIRYVCFVLSSVVTV